MKDRFILTERERTIPSWWGEERADWDQGAGVDITG
jgi:hypothetical protein